VCACLCTVCLPLNNVLMTKWVYFRTYAACHKITVSVSVKPHSLVKTRKFWRKLLPDLLLCKWWQQGLPRHVYPPTNLHGITSQHPVIMTFTAIRILQSFTHKWMYTQRFQIFLVTFLSETAVWSCLRTLIFLHIVILKQFLNSDNVCCTCINACNTLLHKLLVSHIFTRFTTAADQKCTACCSSWVSY
jgi:hypothetical protein